MNTEAIQQAVHNKRYALGYTACIACLPCFDSDCYYVAGYRAATNKILTEKSVNAENSANLNNQKSWKSERTSVFRHGIDAHKGIKSARGHSTGFAAQSWGMDIVPIS